MLLSGLFLFNSLGYQLVFGLLFLEQQSEMYSLIDKSGNEELEKIVIDFSSHPDFFEINDREVFYQGCLYDVKFKKSDGSKITFFCKKDEKEFELLSHFVKIDSENKGNSNKNPLNYFLQKTVQTLFFQKLHASELRLPSNEFCYSLFTIQYDQPDLILLTPPPQYLVS
jgi:uncharacterized protein YrzB (UPF0473 family)